MSSSDIERGGSVHKRDMKRVFVFAGNGSEFRAWRAMWRAMCLGVRTDVLALYIYGAHSLAGFHLPDDGLLIRVGTWETRADREEIENAISMCTVSEADGHVQLHMDFGEGFMEYLGMGNYEFL